MHDSVATAPERADFNPPANELITAGAAILAQGEELLATLTDEAYTGRVPTAWNGSIGGHYRHCLDHFVSLLRGAVAGDVDYDHRDRDPRIENDRAYAFELTRSLRLKLASLPSSALPQPVSARCEVSYDHGLAPVTGSTLGRELVYTIAHAIHHYALIGVLANLQGAQLPPHFGVAPSTVKHQAALAAQSKAA
jgi:hypothetical protein